MQKNREIEFNFFDFLTSVLKQWKMIGFWTVLAAVFAVVISGILPKTFRTSANLMVTINPLTTKYTPAEISIPSLLPIFTSDDIVEKVMQKSGIIKESPTMDLTTMKKTLTVQPYIEQDTNVRKVYSPILTFTAKGPSPEMTKVIVDEWMTLSAQRINEVLAKDVTVNLNIVSRSYQAAKSELDTLNQKIIALETELPVLKKELSNISSQKVSFREKQNAIQINIQRTKKTIEQLKLYTKANKSTLSLSKTITDDALWQAMLSNDSKSGKVLQSSLKDEILNPIYSQVKIKEISLAAELEGLQAEQDSIHSLLINLKTEFVDLSSLINEKTEALESLKKQIAITGKTVDEYGTQIVNLKMEKQLSENLSTNSDDQYRFVKIMTKGVANPRKIAPKRSIIVLSITFMAFAIFTFLAFAIEILKKLDIRF